MACCSTESGNCLAGVDQLGQIYKLLTVPPRIDIDAAVSASEVQTHSTAFQNGYHDLYLFLIVECLNRVLAVFPAHLTLSLSAPAAN